MWGKDAQCPQCPQCPQPEPRPGAAAPGPESERTANPTSQRQQSQRIRFRLFQRRSQGHTLNGPQETLYQPERPHTCPFAILFGSSYDTSIPHQPVRSSVRFPQKVVQPRSRMWAPETTSFLRHNGGGLSSLHSRNRTCCPLRC